MIVYKLKPKDFVAGLLIIAMLAMKLRGVDGTLDGAIGLILGYYFVKRQDHIDNGI